MLGPQGSDLGTLLTLSSESLGFRVHITAWTRWARTSEQLVGYKVAGLCSTYDEGASRPVGMLFVSEVLGRSGPPKYAELSFFWTTFAVSGHYVTIFYYF